MNATKEEIAAVAADRAWWMELGDLLGWRMYGWSYRTGATMCERWANSFEAFLEDVGRNMTLERKTIGVCARPIFRFPIKIPYGVLSAIGMANTHARI